MQRGVRAEQRVSAGSIFTRAAAVHARRVRVAFCPSRVPAVGVTEAGPYAASVPEMPSRAPSFVAFVK
jgi:hypothetical protein